MLLIINMINVIIIQEVIKQVKHITITYVVLLTAIFGMHQKFIYIFNPLLTDVAILYPVKTPEIQKLSGVSRGIKWKYYPENAYVRVYFLIKFQSSGLKKETLAQVFPYEFYKLFKNIHFYATPSVTASDNFSDIKQYTNNNISEAALHMCFQQKVF